MDLVKIIAEAVEALKALDIEKGQVHSGIKSLSVNIKEVEGLNVNRYEGIYQIVFDLTFYGYCYEAGESENEIAKWLLTSLLRDIEKAEARAKELKNIIWGL